MHEKMLEIAVHKFDMANTTSCSFYKFGYLTEALYQGGSALLQCKDKEAKAEIDYLCKSIICDIETLLEEVMENE